MKLTVSHIENRYNYATRQNEHREVCDGFVYLPHEVAVQLRKLSAEYRLSLAEMVNLALCYYFGDGENHLLCENCKYINQCCDFHEWGFVPTVPILDKGTVVVGLSTSDQGE